MNFCGSAVPAAAGSLPVPQLIDAVTEVIVKRLDNKFPADRIFVNMVNKTGN